MTYYQNVQKLENIGHDVLDLSVYLDFVQMHTCIKYENSMIDHVGMRYW